MNEMGLHGRHGHWDHKFGCRCSWCERAIFVVEGCKAFTKSRGLPCKGSVHIGDEYCSQHQDPLRRGQDITIAQAEEIAVARKRLDPGPLPL